MELPKKILSISPELKNRILSAGFLIPVVLAIVWYGGILYQALVLLAAIIMSFEWSGIITSPREEALTPEQKRRWMVTGVFYVLLFALPLLYLRSISSGFGVILLLLLIIWSTDIAAYFVGRAVGGPKILPKVSPKKTWAGLLGGMCGAGLVGALSAAFIEGHHIVTLIGFGMILAFLAQAGDFFESWVKRHFGVKDSGNLIPGHGGIMDRMDGFVTVAPVMTIFIILENSSIAS